MPLFYGEHADLAHYVYQASLLGVFWVITGVCDPGTVQPWVLNVHFAGPGRQTSYSKDMMFAE